MGYSKKEIYELVKDIPIKQIEGDTMDGCIVLEGGAFRGVYQEGVLDCLMEHGYNFNTTIGVSAGALNGVGYTLGQIGRCANINIRYRHNGKYVGVKTFLKSRLRSVIGFDFVFGYIPEIPDLKVRDLRYNGRKFVAVATNLETGRAEYFDNSRPDILDCVKASSALPYVSRPVMIDGKPYLDGGCDDRIPYGWAIDHGYKNIIVIRTRDKDFRIKNNFKRKYSVSKRWYGGYDVFAYNLAKTDDTYNEVCDDLEKEEEKNRVFVIYPSKPINIKMLEGDLEKLKELYLMGYNDALNSLERLDIYLRRE